MFWDSVQEGLKALTFWETYLAAFVYQFITYYFPMIVARERTEKSSPSMDNFITYVGAIRLMMKEDVVPDKAGFGSLGVYFIWLLEAIATLIFIVTLGPIILGLGGDASWSAPWRMLAMDPGFFLSCILIMQIVVIILSMLPYLGKIYSLQIFVFGCISLILFLSYEHHLIEVDIRYPFFYLIGFYILGFLILWGSYVLFGLIVFLFKISREVAEEIIYLSPLMRIFQFIPVFMYGAWLGNQII